MNEAHGEHGFRPSDAVRYADVHLETDPLGREVRKTLTLAL
jgi:hypothetical protein